MKQSLIDIGAALYLTGYICLLSFGVMLPGFIFGWILFLD
jgi:hypothetical protein